MPAFRVKCSTCSQVFRLLLTSADLIEAKPCKCGGQLKRDATGLSSQVVERLDNGAMPRALERLADAERLYADRAKNSDPLAGGRKF